MPTYQIFFEGRNGGRTTKAKSDAAWKSIDYDEPPPQITFASAEGAVMVEVSEKDGRPWITVTKKRWKIDPKSDFSGVYNTIYDGPFGP